MTTSIKTGPLLIKYFTKDILMRMYQKDIASGTEEAAMAHIIDGIQDGTCCPITHNNIQDGQFTVTVAINEQGDTIEATIAPDEFEALPIKNIIKA